jgi:hypothetical protein
MTVTDLEKEEIKLREHTNSAINLLLAVCEVWDCKKTKKQEGYI